MSDALGGCYDTSTMIFVSFLGASTTLFGLYRCFMKPPSLALHLQSTFVFAGKATGERVRIIEQAEP
jgi:hypothetical protein